MPELHINNFAIPRTRLAILGKAFSDFLHGCSRAHLKISEVSCFGYVIMLRSITTANNALQGSRNSGVAAVAAP
jgi:hypothetical protein